MKPTGGSALANVTITTTTEKIGVAVAMKGIRAGQPILLMGFADVVVGADTTKLSATIHEGITISGATQGEAQEQTVVSSQPFQQLRVIAIVTAFQDDPIYSLGVKQDSGASGNGAINAATLIAFPLNWAEVSVP